MASRRIRDPDLLDVLAAVPQLPFQQTVWRITRQDRDPLLPSSPKGRWDDGSFNVLYTACEIDAAKAEVHFHLARGQPVFPSRVKFHLHEIQVSLARTLQFASLEDLAPFAIDKQAYGNLSYARLAAEYAPSQIMAEAAHFLGSDGLVVPCARWPAQNAVLFMDELSASQVVHIADHGAVDLLAWARENNH